jgi:arylformamidase
VTAIVDLSHVIEDGTITYPGLPAPVIADHLSREMARERYAPGYEIQIGRIEMVANTGTYVDTPFHFRPDGHDLSGIDLARVTDVPGIVVDATSVGHDGGDARDHEIAADVLDGLDLAGRAVLFHTGWDRHWGTDQYGRTEHPHLGTTTTARLVDAGVTLVGIDSVNIDGTHTGERPVHASLLAAGILIVEHLTRLDQIAGRPFTFFAVPPAVRGMGSFPVRALALVRS